MKRFLTFAICATFAAQTIAQPVVTPPTLAPVTEPSLIQDGDKTVGNIKGDRTWSLHIDELNAYRAKHAGFKGKYCQVKTFEGREDITSPTAEGREILDDEFKSSNPSMGVFAAGATLSVGQGIYEKCDGTQGSILTVVRTVMGKEHITKEILYAQEYDDVLPIYLFEPKSKSYIAGISFCLQCGQYVEIHYNPKTKKISLVDIGD